MDRLRPAWAVKAIVVLIFSSILFRCVSATNHSVGGTNGWDLASDMQNWSSSTTIYTGDNLVFTYAPNHDVLEVNQRDFDACRIISPIGTHNDGNTLVPLDNPGTRFFICGTRGHCELGLKVQVDILLSPGDTGASSPNGGSPSQDKEPTGGTKRRHPPPDVHRLKSPPPPRRPHGRDSSRNPPSSEESEGPCFQRASASKIQVAMGGPVDYYYVTPLIIMVIFS